MVFLRVRCLARCCFPSSLRPLKGVSSHMACSLWYLLTTRKFTWLCGDRSKHPVWVRYTSAVRSRLLILDDWEQMNVQLIKNGNCAFYVRHLQHQPIASVNIAGCLIKRGVSVLDLGVTLDQCLTTSTQCESSLQVCILFPQAYRYNIPQYLNQPSTEKLIHAFLSSKLDYCYSLLYGHPDKRNLSRKFSVFRTQLLDWLQKLERESHNSNSP